MKCGFGAAAASTGEERERGHVGRLGGRRAQRGDPSGVWGARGWGRHSRPNFSPPCAPCRAREAGGGVRVRDLADRTGTATAVRGGLAVVTYPDGVERLDPA